MNAVSLFQTTNSGASWTPFDTNIPGAVTSISADPTQAGVLVAGTDTGIYRSIDSGGTWTLQSTADNATFSRSPANSSYIYAASASGILLSTDRGVTWNNYGDPVNLGMIVPDPLVATTAYGYQYEVYKTTDGGSTWTAASSGLPSSYISSLVAASDGSLYAAIYRFGIFKSTNQGTSWGPVNTGLPNLTTFGPLPGSLTSASSASVLYTIDSGTVYVTINGGGSWSPTAGSLPAGAEGVTASPQNSSLIYATSVTPPVLYVSGDGGTTWNPIASGLGTAVPRIIAFDPADSAHLFAITGFSTSGFVAKINSSGTALVYSTYLGTVVLQGIATNGTGDAYATGYLQAFGFPSTTGSAPTVFSLGFDSGFVTRISDSTAPCSFALSPANFLADGSSQTIDYSIIAPSGCAWTASSNQSWASIQAGAAGTGTGVISVVTAPNTTGATRSAMLTVGGQTATLKQADSSCSYAFANPYIFVRDSGGLIQMSVAAPPGCDWVVTNGDPFDVTVVSGAGSGAGTVSLSISENPSENPRSFSIEMGPSFASGIGSVTIHQDGQCTFTLAPGSVTSLPAIPSLDVLNFTASNSSCSWFAQSSDPQLFGISAPVIGTGNPQIPLQVSPNGSGPRSARISIGAATSVEIVQDGAHVPDFNSDTKADVFLYDPAGGNGYAGLSNGSGTFSYVYSPFTPGFDVIRYGDFSYIGHTGLIAYDSTSALAYTLLGTGSGTFNGVSLFLGPGFKLFATGDLNGDGLTDFVMYRATDGTMYSALDNGDGTFRFQYTLVNSAFTHLVMADFNGDGYPDILLYRQTDGLAYVGINNDAGDFTFSPVAIAPGYDFLETGDVDGDGSVDLLLYSSSNGASSIGLSTGSGFTFSPLAASPGFTSVAMFDYNRDGFADIVFYNQNNALGYLLIGNGNGGFTGNSLFWGSGMQLVEVADLNGDGNPDVIIYNTNNGASYAGLNTGNSASPFAYTYAFWGQGKLIATAAAQP